MQSGLINISTIKHLSSKSGCSVRLFATMPFVSKAVRNAGKVSYYRGP